MAIRAPRTPTRYETSSDSKYFVNLWMALEKRVLNTNNISSSRYSEVSRCIQDLLKEDYVHKRDLENVIYFLFSDHSYAKQFSSPYSAGLRTRPYDVWFLKKNYSHITFVIAEIEDCIPQKYLEWKSPEFRKDLGIIFHTRPEYQLEPTLSVAEWSESSFLYKTIKYRDVDDWQYFLHVGGGESNFRLLFAKLYQDKRTIPKIFVIWYYEHFRNKKRVVIRKPIKPM